jgi:hypothetical protein
MSVRKWAECSAGTFTGLKDHCFIPTSHKKIYSNVKHTVKYEIKVHWQI